MNAEGTRAKVFMTVSEPIHVNDEWTNNHR